MYCKFVVLSCAFNFNSFFQIFDANGWTTTLLTELYVPIPEASMVAGTVDIEPFEFSSDHFMTYKHDGVGSGKYVLQLW